MNALHIATRGYLGGAGCVAARGYICGALVAGWVKLVHFSLSVTRRVGYSFER